MKPAPKYKVFGVNNFRKIPQVEAFLSEEERFAIEVVGNVLPFKVNNYVIDELIDWENVRQDPLYILTFPQKEMLSSEHFDKMATAILQGGDRIAIKTIANEIRYQLNPHPAGQQQMNVPEIDGQKLPGIQHKYDQTILFFPQHGQTCHAYCTFCFRWPQFVGIDELKFAMKETELMIKYLKAHPEVTDVLFTGGDPMIMKADRLRSYILPLLEADLPNLQTIRIGTKALGYWPYRFTHDNDAEEVLDLFRNVKEAGKHLAFMAHFNSPVELKTEAVADAVRAIKETGAEIRTQSPIMRNINDSSEAWSTMWKEQVRLGMIPYYMFLARDTGPQDYFAVPLIRAWEIFQKAYSQVSGIARTVRGPSMSAGPGKVHIIGPGVISGKKVLYLTFIQGRNADWVNRPFVAKYDPEAIWLDDLVPAFGEDKFMFEKEYEELQQESMTKNSLELVPNY
ncbi:KamA family radical SAM protein [Roseivirga sp. BDSF3-8]|uniref:KamA family radical SAM protein n=1 Tax=Roseivirga sp. BDSF3-8 TaxID=3241598 RepID=UPI0035323727